MGQIDPCEAILIASSPGGAPSEGCPHAKMLTAKIAWLVQGLFKVVCSVEMKGFGSGMEVKAVGRDLIGGKWWIKVFRVAPAQTLNLIRRRCLVKWKELTVVAMERSEWHGGGE